MAFTAEEARLRAELQIPDEATSVVFLAQNAHLDWDWNETFQGYLRTSVAGTPVQDILSSAFELLRNGAGSGTEIPYYYSIAEMGFLRAFVEANPGELDGFSTAIGQRLRIVGGGVTSPDNLLPHGEAFLRNYLLGVSWAADVLGLPAGEAWIPDDFGHDAQLPVLVGALGFRSAAFGRLPGWNNVDPLAPGSPAAQVMADGLDFFWQASDGSTILAHYIQYGYCEGGGIAKGDVLANVEEYYERNAAGAGTPYVFVSVGCDFSAPVQTQAGTLRDIAAQWNEERYSTKTGTPYAVAASFDFYVDLLLATDSWTKPKEPRPFYPTPFLTGFYASRPELKILHQRATRGLLEAEVLGLLADSAIASGQWAAAVASRTHDLEKAWNDLVPSTHHDYITGTASGSLSHGAVVYPNEQVPLLRYAVSAGEDLRNLALAQIATGVDAFRSVVVANGLGWERSGVVELEDSPGWFEVDESASVQQSAGGGVLFAAQGIPGFGYATVTVGGDDSTPAGDVSQEAAAVSVEGGSYVMSNGLLTATIGVADGDWVISSLTDEANGGAEVFPGGPANGLVFFEDTGSIYNFCHENFYCMNFGRSLVADTEVTFGLGSASVLEKGPLRVRVLTRVTATVQGSEFEFEREFTLVAGEPFLRVRARGAAPTNYSVAFTFPVPEATSGLAHGTTYHWDDADALEGWQDPSPDVCVPPVFQPIHDFVIPQTDGSASFAVYTDSMMAWSLYAEESSLLTVPWRNNPNPDGHGSSGPDAEAHTHRYAVRVPTGLSEPSSGGPLCEARAMQTPLLARAVPLPSTKALPLRRGIAVVESVTDGACVVLTAAKAGTRTGSDVVLRFYKPTNGVQPTVEVSIDRTVIGAADGTTPLSVRGVTALETDLPDADNAALAISTTATSFTFSPSHALTTLAVSAGS